MILDARALPPRAELAADVCVVGAGPVGLAVVESLAAAGLDVVVLDSGGPEQDQRADDLGEAGEIRFGTVTRLGHTRRPGGNAHAWQVRTGPTHRGVRLLPLSGVELEAWPGDPASAWPVAAHEVARYAARAQAWFGLPASGFDLADRLADGEDPADLPGDGTIRSAAFLFADGGALAARAVPSLAASSARCYHHATALEVLTDRDGGAATGVRFATAPGREGTVRARTVVVAAGGLATTQLLLASDRAHPGGLGNAGDQLGRNFMDHLLLDGGRLWPPAPGDVARWAPFDLRVVDGTPVMGHLALTDEAVRDGGLAAMSMLVFPRATAHAHERPLSDRQQDAVHAAFAIREALLRRQRPERGAVPRVLRRLDGVATRALAGARHPRSSLGRGGWSVGDTSALAYFDVVHQAEQAPHRDNRVTLTGVRDPLGQRRIGVDWRWHDADVAAARRSQEAFAAALARAGLGRLEPAGVDGAPVVASSSSHHFMGTTRMSTRPADGVVDPTCAVHGVPNLYVASSRTFPRGGYANVTLTAVALGLRVADHVVAAHAGATIIGTAGRGGSGDDGATADQGDARSPLRTGLAQAVASAAIAAGALASPAELPPPQVTETTREETGDERDGGGARP